MSFFRSFVFLGFISLIASLALFAAGSVMRNSGYRGGYAVLSVDASVDDRSILERLNAGNVYFGGSPLSESLQWVALDDFGALEIVSLDAVSTRLASFDPRNDGYAGKLKDFFLHDDKRFVFIPLKSSSSALSLDKRFNSLMGNIPFSVDYFNFEKPFILFFSAYAVASLALLVICYVKKNARNVNAFIIALLPVFSSFAFFGAPGIACAALLLGLFVILREPLNIFFTKFVSGKNADKTEIVKNVLEPYKLFWLSLPVFLTASVFIAIVSELKLLFVLFAFITAVAVSFFSDRILSQSSDRRRRFTPVMIIRRKFPEFDFSAYMAPFACAALLVIILSVYISGAFISDKKFNNIIEEKDYYDHLNFQASFSTRQLGMGDAIYPGYILDKDGLPSPDRSDGVISSVQIEDFPPFPLKDIMDFLNNVNNGNRVKTGGVADRDSGEYLSMLILLLFIIPGFLFKGKFNFPSKENLGGFKRFSGKFLWADKKRKNTLLYKGKNNLNLRKDA